MDSLHYQILKILEPHGVAVQVNLSPFLTETFPVTNRFDTNEIHPKVRRVQELLQGMEKDDLIKLQHGTLDGLGSGNATGGYQWVYNMQINASITSKGLQQLSDESASAGEVDHPAPV